MGCKAILTSILALRRIIIVILTPIIFLPLPLAVGSSEAKCAYVVLIMAVYWVSEALPIAVTSLLPIILFPITGVMSAKTLSAQYINDTSLLFMGGLIVAAAIEEWNIHKRIALGVLTLVGSEPRWLMLGLMLPTWFLSMWISNTATTAMMIPIANAVLLQLKEAEKARSDNINGIGNEAALDDDGEVFHQTKPTDSNGIALKEHNKDDLPSYEEIHGTKQDDDAFNEELKEDPHFLRMAKALSLSIAYSANTGGIGSLTGTGPNVVMKGQADIVYERQGGTSPITFATWMQFGLPLSAIILVILWIWLQIFFLRCKGCCSSCGNKNNADDVNRRVKMVIRNEYKKLGPLNFAQAAVIGHFILLAVLWITRDLGGIGGWGDIFPEKTVTDSTSSILIAASLFIFPSAIPTWLCKNNDKEKKRKVTALMTWNVAEKKLPWGVMLLLGGGFALAKASEDTGLSHWLGDKLTVFSSFDPWVMNLVLCYIVAAATEVTSNTAICTLMMPIMAALSFKLAVNPLYFMFPTAIATSFAFMLPVATPPNAVVFSYGYVKVIDMVSAGFFMNLVAVPVLVMATETWGNSMFGFHTLPEIFRTNLTDTQLSFNETCWCTNNTVNSTISTWINDILNNTIAQYLPG